MPQQTADSEEDEAPSVELRLYMLSNAAVTKEPGQTAHLVIDSRKRSIIYADAESRLLPEASDVPVPSDGRSSDDGHEAAATEARNTHRMFCFLKRRAGVLDNLHNCHQSVVGD